MKLIPNFKGMLNLICVLIILSGCSGGKVDDINEDRQLSVIDDEIIEIETIVAELKDFQKELKANGKMISSDRADLKFLTSGYIKGIYVSEGQTVKCGQLIAQIEDSEIHSLIRQNELDRKKAMLDYEDQLLRLGHKLNDTVKLDQETKSIARLRSGLSLSEITFAKTKKQLENTKLLAPFDGKVANLKAKPFNNSTSFEYVCTLVNNDNLNVEFKVLEQELHFVQHSDKILVTPFSLPDKKYSGRVKSINPLVDNSGMITVKAEVEHDGRLLDGMSVNISIVQNIPKQVIVPKESVLDRQNKKVVFTVKNDSIAHWNYVEIGGENSANYAIKSGLKAGEEVIYKGNFNLAHDRKVRRSKQ